MGELHEAAFRAGVWSVIEARAQQLKDEAKAELLALEVGDTVAGKLDGQIVAKATKTKGRTRLVIADERALLEWVARHHPSEIASQINPVFLKLLESKAREVGGVIDSNGEVVPGIELVEGEPSITVRKAPDAPFLVAQLLSGGHLSLEGVVELEALVKELEAP